MKTFNQTELADLARLAHYLTVTAVEPGISAAADLAPAPTPGEGGDRKCEICGTLHQDLAMNDIGGLTVCDYCEDDARSRAEESTMQSETASAAPTPGEG